MQERDLTIITVSEITSGFKEKLRLWKGKLERGRIAEFPSLNEYWDDWQDDEVGAVKNIKPTLLDHLEKLITEFDRYYQTTILLLSTGSETRSKQPSMMSAKMFSDCKKSLLISTTMSLIGSFLAHPLFPSFELPSKSGHLDQQP